MAFDDIITITDKIRQILKAHQKRTNVKAIGLLKNTRRERPEGLTAYTIIHAIDGRKKKIHRKHLDYILEKWEALPDAPERVQISPETRDLLCNHHKRTGIGSHAITTIRGDCPYGLRSGVIQQWLNGTVKSANKTHFDYVIELWSSLPDR
ncbi:MAG: hypothetical protein JJ964_02950 [Rhizobiales bacterium]|jgi:hypothetical protein|nr:hypothetical protein [Hyphomicrobiales bacterium]